MLPRFKEGAVRVLIETLRLSKYGNSVDLSDIAQRARATESFVRGVVTDVIGDLNNGQISLRSELRIKVALEIARAGLLEKPLEFSLGRNSKGLRRDALRKLGFGPRRMCESRERVETGRSTWLDFTTN